MRGSRLWLTELAACAWIAAACSNPLSAQQRELDANRERWQASDIVSYTYRLEIGCFCPPEITSPVLVRVSQDSIVSVVYAASGDTVAALVSSFYTVGGLFEVVEDAIEREAHELSVIYDDSLGYPRRIVIDYEEQAVDEELALTASDLTPDG